MKASRIALLFITACVLSVFCFGSVAMAVEFDPVFYASAYPDVVSVLGNSTDAFYNHYLTYGMKEGRYPYAGAVPGEKTDGIKTVSSTGATSTMSTFSPVPIKKLANYSSIKKKMTDAEFQQAYNVALQIVTPLADKSREDQIVLSAIQKQLDLRASSAEIREERRQGQQEKMDVAESKLRDLQLSLERLHGDQMEAFEAYKDGATGKETFLQQKTLYDQLEIKLNEGIQKQTAVVRALEQELDAMPEGLTVAHENITADKLTKELVDAFVEKVILKPERQVEIVWKFKQ